MPTIVGILTFISMINITSERLKARNFFICQYFSFFYEHLKFHAQLSWAWNFFIALGPVHRYVIPDIQWARMIHTLLYFMSIQPNALVMKWNVLLNHALWHKRIVLVRGTLMLHARKFWTPCLLVLLSDYLCKHEYCKSGNFRENFIFLNSFKRHTCKLKISRLGYDWSISVVDRVISPFGEDFIFAKLRICEVSRK